VAAALAAWVIAPERRIAGAALIAAGVATLIRLARWRGPLSLAEPLVWSPHLGFVWVPVGLVFLGLGAFLPGVPLAAVHQRAELHLRMPKAVPYRPVSSGTA
jgi:uncharacterized protein involved in response to NO